MTRERDPSTGGTSSTCPACGSESLRSGYGNAARFQLCKRCGVLVRSHLPSADELTARYATAYSGAAVSSDRTGFESDRGMLLGIAELLGQRGLRAGFRVLDYGAGTGRLATILRQLGAAVDGVETAEAARLEAKRRYGFEFYPEISAVPAASFDFVVSVEVIEHLTDPHSVLRELRRVLKPGGHFFLTTPNARGLRARVYGTRWREAANPFHLMLFTEGALRIALERAGFGEIECIRFSPVGEGSFPRKALNRVLQLFRVYGGIRIIARRPNV